MQSAYADHFRREMGCTEADWLRWLPAAIGAHEWRHDAATALVSIGQGALRLAWHAGAPRVIAQVRMPRLHVEFRFEGITEEERLAFMRRFDLFMQRGGG